MFLSFEQREKHQGHKFLTLLLENLPPPKCQKCYIHGNKASVWGAQPSTSVLLILLLYVMSSSVDAEVTASHSEGIMSYLHLLTCLCHRQCCKLQKHLPPSFHSRTMAVRTGGKTKQGGNSVTCSTNLRLTLGNKVVAFPASVITTKPAMNTKDLKNNPRLQMHIDFQ